MLAAQADGKTIETIEGLAESGRLAALQKAFIARNAAQCAFCSSGMLLTAYELVRDGAVSTRQEIRDWCRAWSERAADHEQMGRLARAERHVISAGEHLDRAAVYYHFAKFLFVHDPTQMKAMQ